MSKLVRQIKGEKPEIIADGSRQALGTASLGYMQYLHGHGCKVRGCVAEWYAVVKGTEMAVWVEPGPTWLAEAPIPDFCKAPEGAPQ
jgi:hypothetical protein